MNPPPASRDYRIAAEPRGPALEALLDYCAAVGSCCSLVDQFPQSKKGRAARERFLSAAQSHLLGIEDVSNWPGTPRVRGTVQLWKFAMDAGMRDVLVAQAKGLYDFRTPKLPEDLAVYPPRWISVVEFGGTRTYGLDEPDLRRASRPEAWACGASAIRKMNVRHWL